MILYITKQGRGLGRDDPGCVFISIRDAVKEGKQRSSRFHDGPAATTQRDCKHCNAFAVEQSAASSPCSEC